MAGQVQMIYIDPPYGINYSSNWQSKISNLSMSYSNPDEDLSGEPETIKAFRDTWELGIHSFLSYLRDRLLIAKELLSENGSCFIQIGEDNLHLVRNLMDEVFGSENFIALIAFKKKKMPLGETFIFTMCDYLVWYGRNIEKTKFRRLYTDREVGEDSDFNYLELEDGTIISVAQYLKENETVPKTARYFQSMDMRSSGRTESCVFEYEFQGKQFSPGIKSWKTNMRGMERLKLQNRLFAPKDTLRYKLFFDDYPVTEISHMWMDTQGATDKKYVVQTATKVVERCLLMTTDPGDLVLDPTCGSGTTAAVAEQFGRRWITTDTSRIALNVAKTRLMTATFPHYKLYDSDGDIRQGFEYSKARHLTLGSIANDEPADDLTLYDRPIEDSKKLRVSGPFTVETLQNFEPLSPKEVDEDGVSGEGSFEQVLKSHLLATGIKNGRTNEHAIFTRVEMLSHGYLHAEGFYRNGTGEKKAYFHFGPKFGTVSRKAVSEAIVECRARGDAKWLVVLGFSFESDIEGSQQTTSLGSFEVTRVRIHDDLLQEGLKKRPSKSAASFVTIGEPDIGLNRKGSIATVEVRGLDIYDPIKDEVKARDRHDINYWMVDDDYDGSNFVVKQVYFCGGDRDEFDKWRKGLDSVVKDKTRLRAERTLKIEIDEEAFDSVYGFESRPIKIKQGQKIAVRVISQYGEESMRVLTP